MEKHTDKLSLFGNSPNFVNKIDSRGLGYILYNCLLKHGNNIMQIDAISGKKDTFQQFLKKTVRTAINMNKHGLHPQDKITICTYNSLNSLVPLIASFFTGVIPNTLDPSFSFEDFKYFLKIIKPKMILVCPEAIDSISKAVEEIHLDAKIVSFGKSEKYVNFDTFLEATEEEENSFEPFCSLSCMETAIILFSSGTTGEPKPICLSHNNLLCSSVNEKLAEIVGRELYFSSLYWISQVSRSILSIVSGYTKIIYPKYDGVENMCKIVKKYDVSSLFFASFHLPEVILYCQENNITLPCKYMILAGSHVPLDYIKMASKIFPNGKIISVYAQTEIGMISGFNFFSEVTEAVTEKVFKGSVGKIVLGKEVRIVNLDTEKTVKLYEEGEIRIKCKTVMNGYYQKDSPDFYDSEGWIKTGDIGYFDEDGYLYISGRCKEMIRYKLFPIFPAVLQEITMKHPSVKQCVVMGIPHKLDGDHPIAFVTLKNGCQADPEDIKQFVDQRVDDRQKLRGGVVILESIPVTSTGKPQRRALVKYLPKHHN